MSRRVLVYQIGALGDTIVSIPSYRAVRRNLPGSDVRILQARLDPGRVSPSDLLVREGLIDGVLTYPLARDGSGLKTKLSAWRTVLAARPHVVVYIGPAERPAASVRRDKAFFRMCGVARLIGFHPCDYGSYETRDAAGQLPAMPAQSQMRIDRLAKDGFDVRPEDLRIPLVNPSAEEHSAAQEWLSARRRHPGRKLLAMGVGTAQQATKWPIERFEAVGRTLIERGLAEVIVVGGPQERETGESLLESWGEGINAAGEFDVHGTGALFRLVDLYLGLDSGATHLASAVGTPIVGLYSDHNQPGEWSPMGEGHLVISHRVPCGGCRSTECRVPGRPCMTGIEVGPVVEALAARL